MRGVTSLLLYMPAWRGQGNFHRVFTTNQSGCNSRRPINFPTGVSAHAANVNCDGHDGDKSLPSARSISVQTTCVSSYQASRLSTAGPEMTKTFVSICLSCVKITAAT